MDKNELKRILREQSEPLSAAVAKKLAYLQSDEVFAEVTVENKGADDDSLLKAFGEAVTPMVPVYQPPEVKEVRSEETSAGLAAQEATAQSIVEHKQNIAAKIAALRGISLAGGYLKK